MLVKGSRTRNLNARSTRKRWWSSFSSLILLRLFIYYEYKITLFCAVLYFRWKRSLGFNVLMRHILEAFHSKRVGTQHKRQSNGDARRGPLSWNMLRASISEVACIQWQAGRLARQGRRNQHLRTHWRIHRSQRLMSALYTRSSNWYLQSFQTIWDYSNFVLRILDSP